jgi:hypothetical protein
MKHLALAAALLLAACSKPLQPADFADSGDFNPVVFFTGHVTSWGVEENRAGQPIGIVTTDCQGTADPRGGIDMVQSLRLPGGASQTRSWHLTQTGTDTYRATANDMQGATTGAVGGRAMHWRWVLETSPGDGLKNVTMDQWFYRMDNGEVMIRTDVTKAGIRLIGISEVFERR